MYWKITSLCISMNCLSHLFRLETGMDQIFCTKQLWTFTMKPFHIYDFFVPFYLKTKQD